MQPAVLEFDLIPAQVDQFGNAQAMPEGNEDHRHIPQRPAVALHRGEHALVIDLCPKYA